jgi:hypothetical protein
MSPAFAFPKLHVVAVNVTGEWIDVVQLADFDHQSDDGAVLGACEERSFPVEDGRTDGAFDGAVVELDRAVIKEARQSLSAHRA